MRSEGTSARRVCPPSEADLEAAIRVEFVDLEAGYPASGTRNVSACIGSRVCPFANYDTTALAQRIERVVFPNDYHVKIAVTGCPNDCAKAHMQDFGIIGQARVEIDPERCVGCEACIKNCRRRVTGALSLVHNRAVRDERRCIGCGECVLRCPTNAWTRNPTPYFRMVVLGRTGKRNPRLAATFLEWITEDVVLRVLANVYPFIDQHIDTSLPKEHLGYIVDRVGYPAFRDAAMNASPMLLEPIIDLQVTTPEEFFGAVTGDLAARRAVITSTTSRGNITVIEAKAPLAELFGYATTLRSLSQGRANQTNFAPSGYEMVPENISKQLIESWY